jgi:protein ImuA
MTPHLLQQVLDQLKGATRRPPRRSTEQTFSLQLKALDQLLPKGRLNRGAVHEVLVLPGRPTPRFFAMLMARSALKKGAIVWCDPKRQLYPPAMSCLGVDLERLILLRPKSEPEAMWAIAECVRCPGVDAVVAAPGRMSQVEARRLQLAAEQGGAVGILLRPMGKQSVQYAAATRWLVEPAPGDARVQRWKIQLIHGHGGQIDKSVLLEVSRETHALRASEALADRSTAKTLAS